MGNTEIFESKLRDPNLVHHRKRGGEVWKFDKLATK